MSSRPNNSRRPAHRGRGAFSFGNRRLANIALVAAIAFVVVIAVKAVSQCSGSQQISKVSIDDPEALTYVAIPEGTDAVNLQYEGFAVSFNPNKHVPNYVVWELTADEVNASESSRQSARFMEDSDVSGSATPADYKNSGYDRGHLAPAADMKWSKKAMDDCHLMTNIAPQTHRLNGGPWKTVEDNCRRWALRDSAIVIVCGPILSDRLVNTIGDNKVVVPERFFKVVLAPYANPPRGIGFIMSNYDQTGGAQSTAVTIDEVEAVTGFDFFSALPDDVEQQVESQASYSRWQRLK